jgi:hypothetical protein
MQRKTNAESIMKKRQTGGVILIAFPLAANDTFDNCPWPAIDQQG